MLEDWNPSQYNFKIIIINTHSTGKMKSYATASGTHNNHRALTF